MDLIATLIQIVIAVIFIAPILWLVGRSLAGKQNAKFTDAIWIVVLGVVIGAIIGAFGFGIIGFIITLIVWLGLIKHFFDCSWFKAFVIAIIAVIVYAIIAFILVLIGIGILSLGFGI